MDSWLRTDAKALAAVVRVWALATRALAEDGGAARAAAVNRSLQQPSSLSSDAASAPSRASFAAGWVAALRWSSQLLEVYLGSNGVPAALSVVLSLDKAWDLAGIRNDSHSWDVLLQRAALIRAMLRCGAQPALSRLLAAEEHRGSGALLDTGTLLHAVQLIALIAMH